MEKRKGYKRVLNEIKSYFIITIGLICYTLAWDLFLIPNNLVGGGVTGAAAILQYATGFPVSYTFFLINIVLLVIALKVLGKGFGIKTVYAIIVASVLLKVLPEILPAPLIDDLAISNGKLLCAIFGGALAGFGIGLTFKEGGSTGGTDIIALMITKYRNISAGRVILLMDIVIIASSMLIPSGENIGQKLSTMIYGYILIAVTSYTLDLFISGTKQSVQIFIFSQKYEEIAERITKEMHRGVSVLDAKGWYTQTDGKVLMVIARKTESNLILKLIKEVDNRAFLSMGSVMGVYGEGFERIKK